VVLILSIFASVNADWSMTVTEFQKCAAAFGHGTPSASIANSFISQAKTKGSITSKLEAYMAIGQLSWESAGFTARAEYACSGGHWSAWPCDSYSTAGCPAGKKYYGRGFIQLTHCFNYKAASADFPGIVENPDIVATDDRIAMGTALWYWKYHVHNAAGVQQGQYGSCTRAINGGLECTPSGNTGIAKQRWIKFEACLQAAGANEHPKEDGCYSGSTPVTDHPIVTTKPPHNNTVTEKPVTPNNKNCRNNNGDSRYDQWCVENCARGNCPASVCKCG